MTRPRTVLLACLLALMLTTAVADAARPPKSFRGTSLWVVHAPLESVGALVAAARSAGARTLIVKAAEGASPEPEFTPALLAALRAGGVSVCAWTFDTGAAPAAEAAAAAAAGAQAGCLVVDAEAEYDGRYGAAQAFVGALRAALGTAFPIALAGQAEVLLHPRFPYSVFLGPGGFNVDMPQIYWRDFGQSVASAFSRTVPINSIYDRPIVPVGQLYNEPPVGQIAEFQLQAADYRLDGTGFFDADSASPAGLAAVAVKQPAPTRIRLRAPTLRPGADGDEIVWAQELLNAAGAHLPVGGFYGEQTAREIVRFQRRHHLHRTGLLDAATWSALERYHAREPSWAAAPPLSAGP